MRHHHLQPAGRFLGHSIPGCRPADTTLAVTTCDGMSKNRKVVLAPKAVELGGVDTAYWTLLLPAPHRQYRGTFTDVSSVTN
jgi:hypothetical protein